MHSKYSHRRKVAEIRSDVSFTISSNTSRKLPLFILLRNIAENSKSFLPGGTIWKKSRCNRFFYFFSAKLGIKGYQKHVDENVILIFLISLNQFLTQECDAINDHFDNDLPSHLAVYSFLIFFFQASIILHV